MSHRELDDMLDFRRRLDALDVQIAAEKRTAIVNLKAIADMKRRREEMAAHLARFEEAAY
jgi:hypothetical protein